MTGPSVVPPLLSAAMIVRDEAHHLGDCLDSLADVVDEIVIVDTGSTDRTVAIAQAAGARVFHHEWAGDFSAARNESLDRAHGQWILYIDADERVRPLNRSALVRRLRTAEELSLRVWLHPFVGATAYREHRLWRHDPRIRFEGVIHEKITPSISAVAAADGRTVGECDLTLDHVGYEGDQTAKHLRNLPLLREQLAAEPGNAFNWHHLGRVLEGLDDSEGAEAAFVRAVDLVRGDDDPPPFGAVVYADLARMRRERPDAVDLVDEGLTTYPTDPKLIHARAALAVDRDDIEGALRRIDELLALRPHQLPDAVAYEQRLVGAAAHAARGLCLLRLDRFDDAATAYGRAAALEPDEHDHAARRHLCEQLARGERLPGDGRRLTP